MEKITGIGGIFLRARDPQALALWYQQQLGISIESGQTYSCLAASAQDYAQPPDGLILV